MPRKILSNKNTFEEDSRIFELKFSIDWQARFKTVFPRSKTATAHGQHKKQNGDGDVGNFMMAAILKFCHYQHISSPRSVTNIDVTNKISSESELGPHLSAYC